MLIGRSAPSASSAVKGEVGVSLLTSEGGEAVQAFLGTAGPLRMAKTVPFSPPMTIRRRPSGSTHPSSRRTRSTCRRT